MDLNNIPALALSILTGLFVAARTYGYDKRKADDIEMRLQSLEKDVEAHVTSCIQKNINATKVEERVDIILENLREMNKTSKWLGDCIISVGVKINASLPDRPL